MKNFKKLLVTLLALVLLIGGATVVSLAADTPAEIVAEAQSLLDQATKEGEFIAVRSQKMRELDKLIDSNYSTIKNSQEWRDFQVGYKAAQKQLKEDSVVEAAASLDKLMDKSTSAAESAALYSGLSALISLGGDSRGYFDTDSADFAALNVRMKVADAIARLQNAEETIVAKERGATLLWISNYKANVLDLDEAITQTPDYALMNNWFTEINAEISATLYAEIKALVDEACLSKTSFDRAIALSDEVEAYFTDCYFDTSMPEFNATRMYANFARAYAYLNEIERTSALLVQGKHLKTLSELLTTTMLNKYDPIYPDFEARYNALIDVTDADSVVSKTFKLLDGYKKDIADVFTEGYAGSIKDAKAISGIADEFEAVIATCYLPPMATYSYDHNVALLYAAIYDFYVAIGEMAENPDDFIARNNLYKNAVTSYNSLSGGTSAADKSYKDAFEALYLSLTTTAGTEINEILAGWLATAQQCNAKNPDGSYVVDLKDVKAAYNNLQVYYLEKATALYYSALENKALTTQIKTACASVENRLIDEFNARLDAAQAKFSFPDDLALTDLDALNAYCFEIDRIIEYSSDQTFVYIDVSAFEAFLHEIYVCKMVALLSYVEIAYAEEGPSDRVGVLYNNLKTFSSEHIDAIDAEAEDYLAYLLLLNRTEVKMGEVNVPGALPYLEALEAVVDNNSFDKVYALMHLNEYMRQNSITRPDASDTTSQSALFYQKYDELAGKVAAWRKAIVDMRESSVPVGDYMNLVINEYDADSKQAGSQKGDHKFTSKDGREYGSEGSQYYMTFEYTKGSSADGYISVSLPSATENVILEMDITTFTYWPKSGVSFNSGAYTLDTNKRIYPWIGGITADGQIAAPTGTSHGYGKTLTDREGGYIIPGQWTHFVIVYNAKEKMVSYYVNDEKIVDKDGKDAWSCAQSAGPFNFNEALRIGHGNSGGGSFSLDNVRLYVGNQPRDIRRLANMSELEKLAFYTDYVKQYIDSNGAIGTASEARTCYDSAYSLLSKYWGYKNEGDTEKTYLFDESTYWDPTASGYVDPGIGYEEFVKAIDDCVYTTTKVDTVVDGALIEEVFKAIQDKIAALEALKGIDNLTKRQIAVEEFNTYVEGKLDYISRFNDAQNAVYDACLAKLEIIKAEMAAYGRANEYIEMVKKFAAARDLYSRTVYRSQALSMMQSMETDAAYGYFDLETIKKEVTKFADAIALFNEQSLLLDQQLIQDNNEIIIDCMSRFPATPEEAMKNYSYLNKYIVLVRRILLEGSYNPDDLLVQDALVIYNKMNDSFYDALQKDQAAELQVLIDQFNAETAYITRLGIYTAVKNYLEQNAATIDRDHTAIKGIYVQFEVMDAQFGSEAGREEQWKEYGEILQANALKFTNLVVQMRFCESYEELLNLREQAAALYYYMDSSSADAKLAVEYYHATEILLAQKAIDGDIFIDTAYALTKATTMDEIYKAILATRAAFLVADTTYDGALTYTETVGETTFSVVFTMADAVLAYEIALAQYDSFVTVMNNEVDVVLDVVCAVRASFPVNQQIVALFKKFYD